MRLAILGTMVWDLIDHPAGDQVERWGGISYSLAAAAASLPTGWSIRPIIKVGNDFVDQARTFLQALPGLEWPGGVVETAEPNNRVHLRYHDTEHRHECLTGGVPPWGWEELAPRLGGVDALFVNLVSGFELALDTAEQLRAGFHGLLYADLHSLLLGLGTGGHRVPRRLPDRDRWLRAFDFVQMNEQELALVAGDDDPASLGESAWRDGLRAILVTRGARGAEVRRPDGESVRTTVIPAAAGGTRGDPTGCGDVWGGTCFVALTTGASVEDAARRANRAAARNLRHRGADGLHAHLRGEL